MTRLTDQQKSELINELKDVVRDELIDELELLAKDEPKAKVADSKVRVPMLFMDNNTAHGHRPGYRFSAKLMKDGDTAREAILDAIEAYEADLTSRWRNTPPEPPINTPSAPVLDSDFDEGEDFYAMYDAELTSRWKGE